MWMSSCFIKVQNGSGFLVLAYPDCPGKDTIKQVSNVDGLIVISVSFWLFQLFCVTNCACSVRAMRSEGV